MFWGWDWEIQAKEVSLPAWRIDNLEGRNNSIKREQIDNHNSFYALHTFEGALLNRQRTYTVEKELKTPKRFMHMFLLDKPSESCSHKMCAFRRFLLCHGHRRVLMWSWCVGQCLSLWPYIWYAELVGWLEWHRLDSMSHIRKSPAH